MATIKSYSDLQQSKKLAEILPLESADMRYGHMALYDFSGRMYDGGYDKLPYPKDFFKLCADFYGEDIYDGSLPCWSLVALLSVLPRIEGTKPVLDLEFNHVQYPYDIELSAMANNLVDACYDMIIRLNELNLL